MSTFIAEPGTRIGGRYRLEDRVDGSSGWTAWKAIDETLARAVTVLTFAPGYPRISEVVTAARAASRLTDARLAQVFDVFDMDEDWEQAYVVMEWAAGESLADLLADGPLDPGLAAEILGQAAEALACAHAAGVAHLCLTPASLHWTSGGGVKLASLGIDAALSGTVADDPAATDTRGLAMLLYAALTARWPGDSWPGLAPAPQIDGHPRSPRQVIAGVPAGLDEITSQALSGWAPGNGQGITTPAAFATALARVAPPPPSHPIPRLSPPRRLPPPEPSNGTANWDVAHAEQARWDVNGTRPRRGYRTLAAFVVLLVVAALGLGAWMLVSGGTPARSSSEGSHHAPGPTVTTLAPVSASAFGPKGGDNQSQAILAIDGKLSTDWSTDVYQGSAVFGNLYPGTGLLLDMGKSVNVKSVRVTFGSVAGADANVQVGNNASSPRSSGLPGGRTLASQTGVGGTVVFRSATSMTGRYVLIWFTKLAQIGSDHFQADVYNVVVRGSG